MAKASDNDFPSLLVTEQASKPTAPASGKQRLYMKTDHKLYHEDSGGTETEVGASGGGAPTTAEYITSASDGTLSAEVVIPGLAGHADIAGSGGAGTSEEYDTATTGLTWTAAPATEDSDTTIKSHLYIKSTDATERFGTKSWSPAGAFDVRCKMLVSTDVNTGGDLFFGLHIQNSDNSVRVLLGITSLVASQKYQVAVFTYESATYTARGSAWPLYGMNEAYLRITRDGSNNFSFWWSSNGLLWQLICTQAVTMTVAKLGYRGNTSGAVAAYMAVDWLRTDV